MLKDNYPCYLAGQPLHSGQALDVTNKYTGEKATQVVQADASVLDKAIGAAVGALRPMRQMKAYQRQQVLQHLVDRCEERVDEFAEALCIEAGKPIRDARGEVTRLIDTLRIAAEESVRIYGELLPLDISAKAANYRGMWQRVPIGVCGFITPFNFPLNLVAHKVGPALAVGCPFVLKPASRTPIGALLLGDILAETDLPEGAFSVLPMRVSEATALVEDDRIKKLSFTGSAEVGWDIKRRAGKKAVTLELGGNAAVIIDSDADIEDAISRVIHGAFYQSGQSCISVQRIYAHKQIYDQFRDQLVTTVKDLKSGDPLAEDTFIGPVISEGDAQRIKEWIDEATNAGARLLCGGQRAGVMVEATLLEKAPAACKVSCDEVFGPVAVLYPFENFDEAIESVNDSAFGLQAGVFTRDVRKIYQAWDELEVGGVIVNDVPSWRIDHMPYGGVKDSGLGREGIRFAIQSMTELRLLALRFPV